MNFLNLIPSNQKSRLNRDRKFLLAHGAVGFIVFLISINSIFLIIARFTLVKHYKKVKEDTTLVNTESLFLQKEITQINKKTETAQKIQENFVKTSDMLDKIAGLVPDGAILNYFQFELKNNTFKISGTAQNRDTLTKMKTNLENAEFLSNIDSPLSNFLEKENIEFKFSGTIKKEMFSSK